MTVYQCGITSVLGTTLKGVTTRLSATKRLATACDGFKKFRKEGGHGEEAWCDWQGCDCYGQ